jgi:DNA-directed RNA polymerase specialized sigma24 family protein
MFVTIRLFVFRDHSALFIALLGSLPIWKESIMRQNKTSSKNRDTYIYYRADGTKVELKPDEDGVTELDIATLHEMDDEGYNGDRREDYHIPVHYQAYQDGDGDSADDRNDYLADGGGNPETSLIECMSRDERSSLFKAIWDRLQPQQRELVLQKLAGRSNVDIAAEEGVTETAIRNRLKKIQEKFKKLR